MKRNWTSKASSTRRLRRITPPRIQTLTTTQKFRPALRQAIADEVQRQLNAEKNAASNPQAAGDNSSGDQAPPALAADQRVFVVSAPLQVYDGDQPCSLTAGDVISRVEDSPGNDNAVGVSVLSSKSAIAVPERNRAFKSPICRTCPTICARKRTKV